ncbi:MAG: FlgD immunoglobulin-like domain containing protein [Candidatus Eisenbacteria bacterium]
MRPTRCMALLAASSLLVIAATALESGASSTPFAIYWTAPGDDGLVGRASAYDLRYSSLPITSANFSLAPRIVGIPAPAVPGAEESFVVSGLLDEAPIYMAIKAADESGNWSAISNILTRLAQTVDVGDRALTISFSSPWPNPARQSVRWAFALPKAAEMQVDVLDVTGRLVHTVASGERGAGRGELSWDLRDAGGRAVGAGLYFVKARLGAMESTKRLVIVR